MDIRGLLLCGGRSTRFGADKLLAPLGSIALVAHSARHVVAGVGNALAVTGLGNAALRAVLEAEGCDVLETDRTGSGMGASLGAAIEAADRADGWIVALGDMPRIRPETLRAVKEAIAGGAPIAAAFDAQSGRRGHPVGFSSELRAELLALGGDQGAREVLARHAELMVAVVVSDPGIFVDVDTAADMEALR